MAGAWIIGIVMMLISILVSQQLKSRFKKYSATPLANGMTGAEIAQRMLHDHGITNVKVVSVAGQLTDHYNPATKTVNLRLCLTCGTVACCDSSPGRHAERHFRHSGHPVIRSFEPGEDWFWDFPGDRPVRGAHLADPQHHPLDQPAPGPRGRVPADWQSHLN